MWGGYAAANIRKWHWRQFNGYGYFWGSITGIGGDTLFAFPEANLPFALPVLSIVLKMSSIAASVLTIPQGSAKLINFFSRTRPWGYGDRLRTVARYDLSIRPNGDIRRDMFRTYPRTI